MTAEKYADRRDTGKKTIPPAPAHIHIARQARVTT